MQAVDIQRLGQQPAYRSQETAVALDGVEQGGELLTRLQVSNRVRDLLGHGTGGWMSRLGQKGRLKLR
jgi:hypothetical protein